MNCGFAVTIVLGAVFFTRIVPITSEAREHVLAPLALVCLAFSVFSGIGHALSTGECLLGRGSSSYREDSENGFFLRVIFAGFVAVLCLLLALNSGLGWFKGQL